MNEHIENLRDAMIRTGRLVDGIWEGKFVGMQLPTECARCHAPSFLFDEMNDRLDLTLAEGSVQQWYWLDSERNSRYVCEGCLTAGEKEEFKLADRYTLCI